MPTMPYLSQIKERLKKYPHIEYILSSKSDWLDKIYRKPVNQWPLWVVWLNSNDGWAQERLSSLESALDVLRSKVSSEVWGSIIKKIQAPSDKENSKGILAELSVWLFLVEVGIPFQLEVNLRGKTNMDVQVMCKTGDLFIEVQWVSPSQKSDRVASVSAQHGSVGSWNRNYEKKRIQQKIYDKISKMSDEHITLVALDYSIEPSLGNHEEISPIGEAVAELFSKQPPLWAQEVARVVDGAIWFKWNINFFPSTRWGKINLLSPFKKEERLTRFMKIWRNPR